MFMRAALAAAAALPALGSGWVEPEERASSGGVLDTTLTVGVSEYQAHGIRFLTRSYDGMVPGPTLRVRPGDTLRLTLRNALGPDGDAPESAPNTTNLHPHGLHVAPAEDDIFANVSAGGSRTYEFHIPADHPQGSFFYHPHRLPGDLIQQLGGMSGLIVVEDNETWPAELRALEQHPVVLQKWLWCRNASDPCGWNSRGHVMHSNHYWFPGLTQLQGPTPLPGSAQPADWADVDYMSVNGAYQPTLSVRPGEWRMLRVLNAAVDMQLRLQLDAACELRVLATDGAFLDAPRRAGNNSVVMSTAQRVDIAVMCPEKGAYQFRSEPFTPAQVDYMGHPGYDEHSFPDGQLLFTISADGAPHASSRLPRRLPERPARLRDLRGLPESAVHARREVWMAGVPSVPGKSSPYSTALVNGVSSPDQWTAPTTFTLQQDALEEWVIRAHPTNCTPRADDADQCSRDGGKTYLDTGSGHVLHMHTNHFQVVRTIPPTAEGIDFTVGDWRDTVFFGHNAPDLVIRFRFSNFTGPTLFHCHYMKHAIQGMVAKVVSE